MNSVLRGMLVGVSALATTVAFESFLSAASAAPVWSRGDNLGRIDNARALPAADLNARAEAITAGALKAQPGELRATRSNIDSLGFSHVRMQQYVNGKPVYGSGVVLHARGDGTVYLINGAYLDARGAAKTPQLAAGPALAKATGALGIASYQQIGPSELAYAVGADGESVRLAWRSLIEYQGPQGVLRDNVYADAISGDVVAVDATVKSAKAWRTYDAHRLSYNSTQLPGNLLCTNTQACGLADAQDAHDGASLTYDYYFQKFGRDSLNNAGLALISSVNVCDVTNCSGWNNAAWIGTQMVYGDGDGVTFTPLSGALDVVGHELTHGVTDYESGLTYANASGALNEALSDIFGANVEAARDGAISADTWKVGEDIYTPGTAGDALRYMNNPTQDGYSRDYYPERIPETGNPTGNNDYGGVHGNSGIFNLAYYLLVQGGTHPRSKTTTFVTGVGLSKAEQIFYRANTIYYTASTGYQQAADGARQAALDLYGSGEAQSVTEAFCAVGVGAGCGGSTAGPALTGLTATSVKNGGARWNATMTATVTTGGSPTSGVSVSIRTSTGATGSCTTASTGKCSATLSRISNSIASVTFTVTALNGNTSATGVPASVVANRP